MHKRGYIVCIMSILCLQDHLTMPDVFAQRCFVRVLVGSREPEKELRVNEMRMSKELRGHQYWH